MAANGQAVTLQLYRRLLRLARSLPAEKAISVREQIRRDFRNNKGEADPDIVRKMLEEAQSKIGYLKIVTPKSRGQDQGVSRYVYKQGSTSEGSARRLEKITRNNISGTNQDPEMIRRHERLLRRQHFMDRGVAPPTGPNW